MPKNYLADLKSYLNLHILGGEALISSCFTPAPGITGVKVTGANCTIKQKDRTFIDYVNFGASKGFCKKPEAF